MLYMDTFLLTQRATYTPSTPFYGLSLESFSWEISAFHDSEASTYREQVCRLLLLSPCLGVPADPGFFNPPEVVGPAASRERPL